MLAALEILIACGNGMPNLIEAPSNASNYTVDNYTNKFHIYLLEKFMYTIAFVEASSFDAKETFC